MSEQNKALARRFVEEVFGRRNLGIIDQLISPDHIWHGPGGEEVHGPAGSRQMMEMYLSAFPDLTMTIDDLVAEGDKVVVRWTGHGTHKGALLGAAPTGKTVTAHGIVISRIKDGRIVEDWEQFDQLSMLQQIGIVPATAVGS